MTDKLHTFFIKTPIQKKDFDWTPGTFSDYTNAVQFSATYDTSGAVTFSESTRDTGQVSLSNTKNLCGVLTFYDDVNDKKIISTQANVGDGVPVVNIGSSTWMIRTLGEEFDHCRNINPGAFGGYIYFARATLENNKIISILSNSSSTSGEIRAMMPMFGQRHGNILHRSSYTGILYPEWSSKKIQATKSSNFSTFENQLVYSVSGSSQIISNSSTGGKIAIGVCADATTSGSSAAYYPWFCDFFKGQKTSIIQRIKAFGKRKNGWYVDGRFGTAKIELDSPMYRAGILGAYTMLHPDETVITQNALFEGDDYHLCQLQLISPYTGNSSRNDTFRGIYYSGIPDTTYYADFGNVLTDEASANNIMADVISKRIIRQTLDRAQYFSASLDDYSNMLPHIGTERNVRYEDGSLQVSISGGGTYTFSNIDSTDQFYTANYSFSSFSSINASKTIFPNYGYERFLVMPDPGVAGTHYYSVYRRRYVDETGTSDGVHSGYYAWDLVVPYQSFSGNLDLAPTLNYLTEKNKFNQPFLVQINTNNGGADYAFVGRTSVVKKQPPAPYRHYDRIAQTWRDGWTPDISSFHHDITFDVTGMIPDIVVTGTQSANNINIAIPAFTRYLDHTGNKEYWTGKLKKTTAYAVIVDTDRNEIFNSLWWLPLQYLPEMITLSTGDTSSTSNILLRSDIPRKNLSMTINYVWQAIHSSDGLSRFFKVTKVWKSTDGGESWALKSIYNRWAS